MKNKIARDMLGLAKELLAIDFSTKDQLDKYLKKHPGADRRNHKVVKTKPVDKKLQSKPTNKNDIGDKFDVKKEVEQEFNHWLSNANYSDYLRGRDKDVGDDIKKMVNDVLEDYEMGYKDDHDYQPLTEEQKSELIEKFTKEAEYELTSEKDYHDTERSLRHNYH